MVFHLLQWSIVLPNPVRGTTPTMWYSTLQWVIICCRMQCIALQNGLSCWRLQCTTAVTGLKTRIHFVAFRFFPPYSVQIHNLENDNDGKQWLNWKTTELLKECCSTCAHYLPLVWFSCCAAFIALPHGIQLQIQNVHFSSTYYRYCRRYPLIQLCFWTKLE